MATEAELQELADLDDLMGDLALDMENVGNEDYYGKCCSCNKAIMTEEDKCIANEK
eukprot:Awhi_evm1s2119